MNEERDSPYSSPQQQEAKQPVLPEQPQQMPPRSRRIFLPLFLFLATCISTFLIGGLPYAVCVMLILTCHELGHFFQTLRYRVPASFPFFVPLPAPPLGTLGAVIGMDPRFADRKAIFDIAITGPIAGLIPALVCTVVGIYQAQVVPIDPAHQTLQLGEPLLFQMLFTLIRGPLPEGHTIVIDGVGVAGWAGIFLTALNMIPVSQLDGGHVLYALLKRKAHVVAVALFLAAISGVALFGLWQWSLLLFLIWLMGLKHPPTVNDDVPLGWFRITLGVLMLAFVIVGFTPVPFDFSEMPQ